MVANHSAGCDVSRQLIEQATSQNSFSFFWPAGLHASSSGCYTRAWRCYKNASNRVWWVLFLFFWYNMWNSNQTLTGAGDFLRLNCCPYCRSWYKQSGSQWEETKTSGHGLLNDWSTRYMIEPDRIFVTRWCSSYYQLIVNHLCQ